MERHLFSRFAESLRQQRDSLLGWLQDAPAEKKAIRLGAMPEASVRDHLRVLDTAIVKAESEELGRCTVCNEFVETHWLETDYSTCVCLEHLSGDERSMLEAELELSQKVQQALLPQDLPRIDGWEIAAFSQPASIVGGDYFDFLHFRDGKHALLIADVMGKGMPASMLMASLQASLRIIIPESGSPGEALSRANRIFHHNIRLTKFVSIVIVRLDPATGVITYANAGHNPPLLVGAQGTRPVRVLRPTGAAIGLVEHARFHDETVEMATGDTLLFYTDGLVEAVNPGREEFGERRLTQVLIASAGGGPVEILKNVRSELKSFVGSLPIRDDTTILVLRRTG
jgi:serine phosphatase RsbU (regulator of sigma subunit)